MPNSVTKDLPPEEGADFRNGPKNPNGNEQNQTEVTPEPVSPSEYKTPEPPKSDDAGTGDGSSNPETKHETQKPVSGSEIVDRDNGKSETKTVTDDKGNTETKDYVVQAGDGETHDALDNVREQQHSADTVEEPLKADGVNEGDLDESMVE